MAPRDASGDDPTPERRHRVDPVAIALPVKPVNPVNDRFVALIAEFRKRIRGAVAHHCRGVAGLDADDIEQEVHVRLWRALDSDRSEPLRASYIQRVVVSTVIDASRRAAIRVTEPLADDDDPGFSEPTRGPTAEQAAIERQRVEVVWAAIDALPVRRRVPVKLHLEGFALKEIGDLEGVSEEAARKLVARGMEALKARLAELGIDGLEDR